MHLKIASFISTCMGAALALLMSAQASESDLQEKLTKLQEETGLVGVGALVMVGGDIKAEAAAGERKKGSGVAVSTEELWHIGSITKSMTATLLGRLVEKDLLEWDQPLPEAMAELAEYMDEGWSKATVRHVLNHTAGVQPQLSVKSSFNEERDPALLVELRDEESYRILSKPPKTPPGRIFQYSNAGYMMAGHIAEMVAGQPWESLLLTEVAEPLGLTTVGFGAPYIPVVEPPPEPPSKYKKKKVKTLPNIPQAWGHQILFGLKRAQNPEDNPDNTPIMGPAGTVHMSLKDLATYGYAHLRAGADEGALLSAETFRELHEPAKNFYAMGWVVQERDWAHGKVIWHNGSNTMWYALVILLPEMDAVMVFATNDGSTDVAEPAFFNLAKELAHDLAPVDHGGGHGEAHDAGHDDDHAEEHPAEHDDHEKKDEHHGDEH